MRYCGQITDKSVLYFFPDIIQWDNPYQNKWRFYFDEIFGDKL